MKYGLSRRKYMSKYIGGSTGSGNKKVIPGDTSNQSTQSYQSNRSKQSNQSDCFVATAAFGTPLQYEIQVLRNWRDNTLRYTGTGRKFIAAYYKLGPSVAECIRKYPVFKAPVRGVVKVIIRLMK